MRKGVKWHQPPPEGEPVLWVLCPRLFSLPCRWESGGDLRGFQENSHRFSRYALFRVMVSTDRSVTGPGSLVSAVGSGVAHLVLLLFWAWN